MFVVCDTVVNVMEYVQIYIAPKIVRNESEAQRWKGIVFATHRLVDYYAVVD